MSARESLFPDGPRCQECGGERGWFGHCSTCGADAPRGSGSLREHIPPYDRDICSRRDHVIGRTIREDDTRLHACDCGCALVGNGKVEIRFGLIPLRFPNG